MISQEVKRRRKENRYKESSGIEGGIGRKTVWIDLLVEKTKGKAEGQLSGKQPETIKEEQMGFTQTDCKYSVKINREEFFVCF